MLVARDRVVAWHLGELGAIPGAGLAGTLLAIAVVAVMVIIPIVTESEMSD